MASDLELSPAAVERGAKGLYDYEWHAARGTENVGDEMPEWPDLPSWLAAVAYRTRASEVLTAALRLDDPETVERVAEGVWRSNWKREPVYEWTREVPNTQDTYRRLGRAAITALLGAEPEEAEDG